MPKVFTSKTQKTGEIGENVACMFLMKRGFEIIDRNYTKIWGEIDIVASKDAKLYFCEVKSVTRENLDVATLTRDSESIGHETYRPEENMHEMKIRRLSRTIETYIADKRINDDVDWQVDLLVVYLDHNTKKAKVERIENVF